ncbi:MAG TPA: type II toxin-antitoxin system Phd/YefM family antitoxin [Acidisarcina sp.]
MTIGITAEAIMQTVAAGVFKAKCLAIMDEVQRKREPVTITKRGKAVARLVPLEPEEVVPFLDTLKGKLRIIGDIESPIPEEEWEIFK